LNPTIEKACAAGIVVVSFDQAVTADCAYKLESDFDTMANNQAEWMATVLDGKGKVLMDRGACGDARVRPLHQRLRGGSQEVPGH
jgi:ribose transport system substrate-binding protein